VNTNLARDLNPVIQALANLSKVFFASPEKGARTSIYLASAPELEGVSGGYFAKGKEASLLRSRTTKRRQVGSGRPASG
jgi:retinol dehydrogenase-12